MSPSDLKRLAVVCGIVVLAVCALVAWPDGALRAGELATILTACPPDEPCNDQYWINGGDTNAIGGRQESVQHVIDPSRLTAAGALSYDDMKRMEEGARTRLLESRHFREDISPHNEKENFDTLVRQFDYAAGFDREYQPGVTLQQRIDEADRALREAIALYGALAVYADEDRFRADGDYASLCPSPPPTDDPLSGDNVDWCNFPARLRQSLREVAYLRMIFGRQFTTDAMGLHFSATDLLGGEAFVRDEVSKLRWAVTQYDEAQSAVVEGMGRALGSGCFISDFYTQPEWDLISRAVEGKERALHEIAVRLSYLDDYGPAEAEKTYRASAMEQYLQMAGTAGQAVRARGELCTRGSLPTDDVVGKMVANLLDTRKQVQELREGRNVFGFDVHFTPARPYLTALGSSDEGLWDEAMRTALLAKETQSDETQASRDFDQYATQLQQALTDVKEKYDDRLLMLTGCNRNDFGSDAAYFACVDSRADILLACDVQGTQDSYNACVAQVPGGLLRQSWDALRVGYLHIRQVQTEMDNVPIRMAIEEGRNVTVTHEIYTNGEAQSASAYTEALLESLSVQFGVNKDGPSVGVSYNPLSPWIASLRQSSIQRQAAMEIKIANANKEAVIRNLLLDHAELRADLEVVAQEFNAQSIHFATLAAEVKNTAIEARRARAYLTTSPANDPSFRLVRDSKRLLLAEQLSRAAQVSYMAAKRAEYEYVARLNEGSMTCGTQRQIFRVSDIYRARTADDILEYLNCLKMVTNNLVIDDSEIQQEDFTVSVALHVLGLTDENLGLTGEAAQAERLRRFRAWIANHTQIGSNGKPVLIFNFSTSIASNGPFSGVIQEGYDRFWVHKVAGIGLPKDGNTGLGMNLITEQAGNLSYRRVVVTQSGLVHLRSRTGCIFEYRLIHPAALLGQDWPSNQPPESATTDFKASVNGANGQNTPAFLARPVSASDWEIEIRAGAPAAGLIDMDLQQLQDIELLFSTTRGSRTPGEPPPEECVRVDY